MRIYAAKRKYYRELITRGYVIDFESSVAVIVD